MYVPTEERKITDEEFVAQFTESNSWRLADVFGWRASTEGCNALLYEVTCEGVVIHYFISIDVKGHRWYFDGSGVYITTAPILHRYDLDLEVREFGWSDNSPEWVKMNNLIRTDIAKDGNAEQYYLQSNFYLDQYFELLRTGAE